MKRDTECPHCGRTDGCDFEDEMKNACQCGGCSACTNQGGTRQQIFCLRQATTKGTKTKPALCGKCKEAHDEDARG